MMLCITQNIKRLISITAFLICTSFCFSDSVTFMTFNIQGLDFFETDGENRTENVKKILIDSKADIILLQEIKLDRFFEKTKGDEYESELEQNLKNMLGYSWKLSTTSKREYRGKYLKKNGKDFEGRPSSQNNAIIYNSSKLRLIRDFGEIFNWDQTGTSFSSCIYPHHKNSFMVLEFEERSSKQTFLLINVHLPYNNYLHRTEDFQTLLEIVDNLRNVWSRKFIIIGGDFNLTFEELKYNDLQNLNYFYNLDAEKEIKTTVSGKDSNFLVNSYDHFFWSKELKDMIEIPVDYAVKVDEFQKKIYNFANTTYKDSVSDHVPLSMTIKF